MFGQLLKKTLQTYTLLGLSVPGWALILFRNRTNPYSKLVMITSAISMAFYWGLYRRERLKSNEKNVIIITGCDSGLGFTMALEALNKLNFTVIAAVHKIESEGAVLLRKEAFGKNFYQIELDISDDQSIHDAVQIIDMFFTEHPDYDLWALVNNAGVMVFGEFEWQSPNLIKNQVDINLIGTMKFTNSLSAFLRRYSSRVINVVSHCGINSLPGLSVYGATKAALCSWSDALQSELDKFNVKVIKFFPGAHVLTTNLMSNHKNHVAEMEKLMSQEQTFFYKNYFDKYNSYLYSLSERKPVQKVNDRSFLDAFAATLLDKYPLSSYINESYYYKVHRYIFSYCPIACVRAYVLEKFMNMPKWDCSDSE